MEENEENLVDLVMNKRYSDADALINTKLADKVSHALDQEKINIATSVYGDNEEDDENQNTS